MENSPYLCSPFRSEKKEAGFPACLVAAAVGRPRQLPAFFADGDLWIIVTTRCSIRKDLGQETCSIPYYDFGACWAKV